MIIFISFLFLPLVEPLFQLFLTAFGRADPFLNKPFIREDAEDSTEYLKNKTKKETYLNFWDAASAVLRGDLLLPVLILGREKKRNDKSSQYSMNFVPFELQTKRKEKKEVINLKKMEEKERELINIINSTWEEMACLQRGQCGTGWRRGLGPARQPTSSFPSDP